MTMSEELRLCMIGAGGHSERNIYPSLFRLRGETAVVAACDLDVARAARMAARHGIPASYGDHQAMLDALSPDGVIICVGPDGHAKLAAELLDRGLHVYTEKPNATSLAQSLTVVAAQKRADRVCMVGYKKRFAPAYVKTKAILGAKDFGQAVGMNVIRSCGGRGVPAENLRPHLLDWTCHTLDLSCFLLGPVRRVFARLCPGERYALSVVLTHCNGAVGHQLFTNAPAAAEEQVYITGTGGVTVRVANSIEMLALRGDQPFAAHRPSFTTGNSFSDIEQGFAGELKEFVAAIRENRRPESDITQATHTLAVFEAMWQSSQTDLEVHVEYQP